MFLFWLGGHPTWSARACPRPTLIRRKYHKNRKSPEPSGSRDESLIRGTTLLISQWEIPSGSDKPYPGNGGNRVPLLRLRPFTEPTQEPDLRNLCTGSHRPPALCSIGTGKIFPSMSLRYIHLTLKHKRPRLSTDLHQKNVYKYTPRNQLSFCETVGLTFFVRRAKVCSSVQYIMAVTKTVRQSVLSESQRLVQADSSAPKDPSLPSRCAEDPRSQVHPLARVKG